MGVTILQVLATPWWATATVGIIAICLGIINIIQFWKSKDTVRYKAAADSWEANADALKAERDTLRGTRDQLLEQVKEHAAQIAVLQAKTDLNGLREKMTKEMEQLREDFKSHSTQDDLNSKSHVEALNALNATLHIIQQQFLKVG